MSFLLKMTNFALKMMHFALRRTSIGLQIGLDLWICRGPAKSSFVSVEEPSFSIEESSFSIEESSFMYETDYG